MAKTRSISFSSSLSRIGSSTATASLTPSVSSSANASLSQPHSTFHKLASISSTHAKPSVKAAASSHSASRRQFTSGFPFSLLNSASSAVKQSKSNKPSAFTASHHHAHASVDVTSQHVLAPSRSSSVRAASITHNKVVDALPLPTFPCEKSAIEKIFKQQSNGDKERAFFIKDVGVVERQYTRWYKNLPNVRAFYAVKCNPDETLLRVLANMDAGFDCASSEEIASCLKTGVSPDDIIFANPIKSQKDLRYAASVNVKKMTFDNEAELYKIKEHHPNCELVLRLLPDDSGSVMRFGVKFGAPNVHIEPLLKAAKSLGLKVIGTSFHIGSGCFDVNSYEQAIHLSRQVHDMAPKLGMEKFTLMDIGGGFPGNPIENQRTGSTPAFEEFAAVIRESIAKHFPPGCGVELIAEPGRYLATAWTTLFAMVQGKREEPKMTEEQKRRFLYYINDGVYGSFNCIMFDHAAPEPIPSYRFLSDRRSLERKATAFVPTIPSSASMNGYSPFLFQSSDSSMSASIRSFSMVHGRDRDCEGTFFGPTCDSMDVIAKNYPVEELFVGDWLAFPQMGAYTNAAASTFNGMPKPTVHYVRSRNSSPFIVQ